YHGLEEMRIQETYVSASCAKMTDEKNMNGDLSSGLKKEIVSESTNGPSSPNLTPGDSECSSSIGGGRLKFFKDGKFILELSHRKEGDRGGCWVPVPKKATVFWPAVGTPRHESSTSLSVSDDNSSVQSSPWQRDHCWKQSSPRQHAGRGLEFYMVRPVKLRRLRRSHAIGRRKRRRPHLDVVEVAVTANNGGPRGGSGGGGGRASLAKVLRCLWERVNRAATADPGIVSPRKRILREMERVTLEDQAKRQRARPAVVSEGGAPPGVAKPPSSHSITSILAREDEPSFLRTLLRSPEPPPPHPFLPPPPLMYPHHPSSSAFLHPTPPHLSWYSLAASSLPPRALYHPLHSAPPTPPPSHHPYSAAPPPHWHHLPTSHHHHLSHPASLKRDDSTSGRGPTRGRQTPQQPQHHVDPGPGGRALLPANPAPLARATTPAPRPAPTATHVSAPPLLVRLPPSHPAPPFLVSLAASSLPPRALYHPLHSAPPTPPPSHHPYSAAPPPHWHHLPTSHHHHLSHPASLKRDDSTSDVPLNLSKHAG
ncbi:WAS/WASL-interacting protein family member 1, partial [Nilaparvata lugens]|uniref:WAS/WASL-interacting protein family member 1 n=1 Tax=Nilaparvata lugens TaxID=108931 RepID=UPI00193D6EAB